MLGLSTSWQRQLGAILESIIASVYRWTIIYVTSFLLMDTGFFLVCLPVIYCNECQYFISTHVLGLD